MATTDVLLITHWEDTDLAIMSRVKGSNGALITQSTMSSVLVNVYERDTGDLVGTETPSVGATVYNSLQTGSGWPAGHTGFNFRHVVSGSLFPVGGTAYRVEIVVTPVSGSTFVVASVDVEARNRFSG